MAKSIFVAKMTSVDDVFKEITNTIEDIVNDKDALRKNSVSFANDLVQKIQEKYVDNLKNISSFEHGSANIKTSITDTKAGFIVHVTGKDVLYQEYGTGSRGSKKPHPRHGADGMKPYGSGRNIIRNGQKNNGKDAPYWYKLYRDFPGNYNVPGLPKTDFDGEQIRATDYVWKHNKIVTKGLPAGRFIYDSCQELRGRGGLGDKNTAINTVTQNIKKSFVDKINTTVKKKGRSWSADALKKRFEYLKMFEGK